MEKDIDEILSEVEVPNFNNKDSFEEIITKYTDYLKKIEIERGLTDEQIKAKYVHGLCQPYVQAIMKIFKNLGKEHQYYMEYRATCKTPEGWAGGTHWFLRVVDENTGENLFYDIYGKHTLSQVKDIQEHFYIDNTYIHDIVNGMTEYEFDDMVIEDVSDFLYDKIDKQSKTVDNDEKETIENFKKSMEEYDTLYTEEQFKLYDEAEKLGLDFKKELDNVKARVALRNDMREYFNDKSNLTIEQINARCTELGLDFNNEMAKAREKKLPIAKDVKESTKNIASSQLSRNIQEGQTEVKNGYVEYESPTQSKDVEK